MDHDKQVTRQPRDNSRSGSARGRRWSVLARVRSARERSTFACRRSAFACGQGVLAWNVALLVAVAASGAVAQPELRVVGTQPPAHVLDAERDGAIEVRFDRAVDRSSVNERSFWAFGRWSGPVSGPVVFANGDSVVRMTPDVPLSAGERVLVILSHDLRGADGAAMRKAGYSYQYWTRSTPGALQFTELTRLSTRSPTNEPTRSYGGFAANLNADRLLDLAIINEETADVRIFLNRGAGGARFDTFLLPTTRVGPQASPSETSDFDRDGNVDACVVNIRAANVSILMGRGDGTFATQQTVDVGSGPRGVAVLDVDGDGDVDIANTNASSSNVTLLLNDGRGNFQGGLSFEAGGEGEWAIEAADMDNDGILDLVVGCHWSATLHVNRGTGNATFEEIDSSASGGAVWMLNCGDLNGDRQVDVVVVNSRDNNATVVLGDGQGRLGAPSTRLTDPFPLATDLADLDGDGDLDWVTSSFTGDWMLFENDGSGGFQFDQRFDAPRAASCSIAFDFDDDGDLDLALVDEIADVVVVYENTGTSTAVEPSEWGRVKSLYRR